MIFQRSAVSFLLEKKTCCKQSHRLKGKNKPQGENNRIKERFEINGQRKAYKDQLRAHRTNNALCLDMTKENERRGVGPRFDGPYVGKCILGPIH